MLASQTQTPYQNLSPQTVLESVEALGFMPSGQIFALNSYENRVYDITMDDGSHVIAKFYRPGRWTKAQIAEEHAFAFELKALEIDLVAPMLFDGESVFQISDYHYALYPKRGGRPVELREDEDFRQVGRLMARIHNVGEVAPFEQRITLTPQSYGWENLVYLRESGMIPADLLAAYDITATQLLTHIDQLWTPAPQTLRLHGDAHLGNILNDGDFFLVDLDDCLSGPAVQDLWMYISGEKSEASRQWGLLLAGYEQLRPFDYAQLALVEGLRSLRMIHYSAWLAKRWQDPTFPKNFPFFQTADYWQRHLLNLKEQLAALQEPTLVVAK